MIISVLLMPTIMAAREARHRRICTDNLRQIGQASALYLQDYDQTYLFAWGLDNTPNWHAVVAPYIKDARAAYLRHKRSHESDLDDDWAADQPVFHCPADTEEPAPVSYATNALISGCGTPFNSVYDPPERLDDLDCPQQLIWVGETNKNWSRTQGFNDSITDWVRPVLDLGYSKDDDRSVAFYHRWLKERDWTDLAAAAVDCPDGLYMCKYPAFRHARHGLRTGEANFLFVDGHVRAFTWGKLNVNNFFPHLTGSQMAQYGR